MRSFPIIGSRFAIRRVMMTASSNFGSTSKALGIFSLGEKASVLSTSSSSSFATSTTQVKGRTEQGVSTPTQRLSFSTAARIQPPSSSSKSSSTQGGAQQYREAADIIESLQNGLPLSFRNSNNNNNPIPNTSTIVDEEEEARKRARDLLESSAISHAYLPAVARLGRWYLFGLFGVKRDLRKAIVLLHQAAKHITPEMRYKAETEFAHLLENEGKNGGGSSRSTQANEYESQLFKSSCIEAAYWYAHAWTKLGDWIAAESALQAAVEQHQKQSSTTTTAVAGGGCGGGKQNSVEASSSSSPRSSCTDGSCGCGKGGCSTTTTTATTTTTTNSDPVASSDNGDVDVETRAAAARQVLAEIREHRRVAKAEKIRRVQGLPPLSTIAHLQKTTSATEATQQDEDPMTLPLKTDESRAEKWFLLAARADHPDAQVALGNFCMRSSPDRIQEGIHWYELACGFVAGQDVGGTPSYLSSPSSSSAAAVRASGASPPHPDALFNLGTIYWEGIEGYVERDVPKSMMYFEAGAAAHDGPSLYFLGALLHKGDAKFQVRPQPRRAVRLLELAAGMGHGGAALYLAQLWRTGDSSAGIERDTRRYQYFLTLAAEEMQDTDACFEIAHAVFRGQDGFSINLPRALAFYETAAQAGHAEAYVCAGAMHYNGHGTPPNYTAAAARYRAAGEGGAPAGWRNLAALHEVGHGVPKNSDAVAMYTNLAIRLEKAIQADMIQSAVGSGSGGISTNVIEEDAKQGCGKGTCGCATPKQTAQEMK